MTRNLKIRTDFSLHESKNSPTEVTDLAIFFSFSHTHILSGVGEEFPNLRILDVRAMSIKFIERHNFAKMTRLAELRIRGTLDFLPEDLLADLPNLTFFHIRFSPLERLPEKIFLNQRKLKTLELVHNGITILQKDLFENNLELEELFFYGNKLVEIYVDFTLLPAVKWINLADNKCINQRWRPTNEAIQTFQDKINSACQPTGGV